MDFSKLYNKLPKKIQKSETFLLYCMRLAKFFHSNNTSSSSKSNEMFLSFVKDSIVNIILQFES